MKKVLKFLDEHLEDIFLVGLLGAISIVMFLQIIMRYALSNALSWPEEFCRVCFIFSGFLCMAYCQREHSAIKVDVLVKMLPPQGRKVIDALGQVMMFAFYAFLFIQSIGLLEATAKNGGKTSAMGLPLVYEYFALTLGAGLAAFRSLQQFVRWAMAKTKKKEAA